MEFFGKQYVLYLFFFFWVGGESKSLSLVSSRSNLLSFGGGFVGVEGVGNLFKLLIGVEEDGGEGVRANSLAAIYVLGIWWANLDLGGLLWLLPHVGIAFWQFNGHDEW